MNIDIHELCEILQENLSANGKSYKVQYVNGIKPSGYHAPQIVTTKMAMSGAADKIKLAWFAEIFINNQCIFRESYIPQNEDWETAADTANSPSNVPAANLQSPDRSLHAYRPRIG